jgi:hypothetical protein
MSKNKVGKRSATKRRSGKTCEGAIDKTKLKKRKEKKRQTIGKVYVVPEVVTCGITVGTFLRYFGRSSKGSPEVRRFRGYKWTKGDYGEGSKRLG